MSTKADKLKESIAKLSQAQQSLIDLPIWLPLQAIEDQLKRAVESVHQLQAYRGQVEDHRQTINDAFKKVQKDSSEIMADIEAFMTHRAQEEAKEIADPLADPQDVCTFNVGGHVFKVRKQILLKSPDSRLAHTLNKAEVLGGELVVDRDPERFRHILNFLRDDFIAPKLSVDKLAEVVHELRFWEVERIPQIPLVADLKALLSKDPREDLPDINSSVLAKWKELGPLSVDQILLRAGKSFIEGFPIEEKKGTDEGGDEYIFTCQTDPETKEPFGIGRKVRNDLIIEGFFEGDFCIRWIRKINYESVIQNNDGDYYLGPLYILD